MGSAHAELPNLSSIFSLSTQGKGGVSSFFSSSSSCFFFFIFCETHVSFPVDRRPRLVFALDFCFPWVVYFS